MKRQLLLIALAVSVVGCAARPPKVWLKAGATDEQFRRDRLTCRQYGMQSAQANGLSGNMFVEVWISDRAAECLQGLGYHEAASAQTAAYSPPIAAPERAVASAAPASAPTVQRGQPAMSNNSKPAAAAVVAASDAERDKVAQVLAESGFPLFGEPLRFKQSNGRSFYEARGAQGQVTQVVCDAAGGCHLRTVHDN